MKKTMSLILATLMVIGVITIPVSYDLKTAAAGAPELYLQCGFDGSDGSSLGTSGLNGVIVGSPAFVTGRKGGADKALELDGTGSSYMKFDTNAFKPSGDFSVSLWAKMSSTNPLWGNGRIISTGVFGWNTPGIMIGFNNNNGGWSNAISGIGGIGWGNFQWGSGLTAKNDDTWHHVAAAYNMTGKTVTIYVDGVSAASYSFSADESVNSPLTDTAIGGFLDGLGNLNEPFKGLIDDVQVIRKVLTADDVASIIADTFQTTTEPALNALISSHYSFNSSTAKDVGNDGLNGELVGSPAFVEGRKGVTDKAVELNGSNYVKVPTSVFKPQGNFSISFWAQMDNVSAVYGANSRVISTGLFGENVPGIMIGFNNNSGGWSNVISGIGGSGWGTFQWGSGNPLLADNAWHNIVAAYNTSNKTITVYRDGNVVANYSYTSDSIDSTQLFTAIGGHLNGDGTISESFKGKIDDVFVIKKALTASDVALVLNDNIGDIIDSVSASDVRNYYSFNGRNANDSGVANIKGQLVGRPEFVQGRKGTSDLAIELNGQNYVELDSSVFKPSGNFTISFWTKMTTKNPLWGEGRVISTGLWGENVPGIMIGFNNNTGGWSNVISGIGGSGWGTFQWGDACSPLNDNAWHNVVGVYNTIDKTIVVYLDGIVKASYSYTSDTINTNQLLTAFGGHLNSDGTLSAGFIGRLDDLMVITKPLPAEQVQTIASDSFITLTENTGVREDRDIEVLTQFDFNDQTATNIGSSKENGVLVGNPTFIQGRNGAGDNAVLLDGSNYVKVKTSAFNSTSNFTVSFWAKMSSTTPLYGNGRVISTGIWGANTPGIMLGFNNNENNIWSNVISGIGGTGDSIFSWGSGNGGTTLNDDTWHSVVGVYNADLKRITVYLDGAVNASYSYSAAESTVSPWEFTAIGGFYNEIDASVSEGFKGAIDDVTVVKKALDSDEVASYLADTLVPAVSLYGVDRLSGNTVSGIATGTTVGGFKNLAYISPNATVEFKNGSTVLGELDVVGTGTTVNVTVGGNTTVYTIIIYGDVSGNGQIDLPDLVALKQHLLKIQVLTGVPFKAGDLLRKDKITVNDLLAVKKQMLELGSISQYPLA